MSLSAKNIPPMLSNDIPEEIWVRNTSDSTTYSKIKSYSPNCFRDNNCSNETPFFRFQMIYDGYDFLYYPEFKLYERPYLILEGGHALGTDQLSFSTTSTGDHDNVKNLDYVAVGDTIKFLDTNDSYMVSEKTMVGESIVLVLDESLTIAHTINDVAIIVNKKYDNMADSNVLSDGTTVSSFKFKFVDISNLTSKNYKVTEANKINDTYSILYNNDTTSITDLWGDNKIVSLSKNINIQQSTVAMNTDLDIADNEIQFTESITSLLDINSYFTLKNLTNLEIVKVTEILSEVQVRVARAQLNTTSSDFQAATTDLYFPKYIYFWMIPHNKYIDFRYIVYRNLDFILTWV